MEFLSEKLTSFAPSALSSINERNRKQKKDQSKVEDEQAEKRLEESETQTKTSAITSSRWQDAAPTQQVSHLPRHNLNDGFPFGFDSPTPQNLRPPPIGFRVDLLNGGATSQPEQHTSVSGLPSVPPAAPARVDGSESSLYEGDAWARLWFQRVMVLTLIKLALFIGKVYEDFNATKKYNQMGNTGRFLLAAITLFLPTIVFTIYRVARYLQMNFPEVSSSAKPISASKPRPSGKTEAVKSHDDSQVKRALINAQSGPNPGHLEEEGLVTARQTPTNFEEFHDSKSQHEQQPAASASPAPSTVIVKELPRAKVEDELKESVDVNKLGQLPDKDTVRITLGASQQLLHGILFVFWQLKRQVDVIGYLIDRSCLWRKPKEQEKEDLAQLRTGGDGLEWFQDFYAAFLAILAQVYTLGLQWAQESPDSKSLSANTLRSAAPSLNSLAASESSDLAVSNAAKALSNTLQQQLLTGQGLAGNDLLIMSELIVSSAVVVSLLVAVKRRDDGPLTLGLSMLGWGSTFAARIIVISLAFVHVGWIYVTPLLACHILGVAVWIYKISLDSWNGKRGESDEWKWDPSLAGDQETIELKSGAGAVEPNVTSSWSPLRHVVLFAQILILFAIPSLFYWPIMFNLKLHKRPYKYLSLILVENTILWIALFYVGATATVAQQYLLVAVVAFSALGFIFISFYICCKPSLTEYFARADELFNAAEKSGVYFEFCSRVFKMPDLSKQTFQRLMNQSEQLEEIQIDQDKA